MSTSASSTLERQNDDVLENLLGKVKSLRGVTNDIYDDAESQRGMLDNTSNLFDNFSARLANSSSRLTHTVVQGARHHRLTLYIVAGFVTLFFVYRWFF
ncbi:hypothetical protein BDZ90DRAFT_257777 [Jaminaea rosea]|uniref:t-SNARE coiled-coil homology domain-containing protein n=1 Tax=Jaminaea rosea TaxID=1569628 RepID=A0A316V3E0_9BASI|nr:hypothetical protein BDZ90DRAFT_257777 [Jaminaea rosea]PWN30713.1 hypothetical protein BDZ90DRAFT_257777 [Jaminaea rosea]